MECRVLRPPKRHHLTAAGTCGVVGWEIRLLLSEDSSDCVGADATCAT